MASACRMRKNTVHSVFRKRFFPILWAAFPLLLEAKARSGQFIFDCAFWGWRHLACRLFRVGTLEFEYRPGRFKRTSFRPALQHTALLCPYTFSRSPNFQIMRCAIPTNRQSASLLCTLRLCMRTVSPWPCCAAPGFSGPRWTHSCRRTPEFSDLETTMRYTRQAPKTNPSICDHSMETAPAALPKQTRLQRTVAAHLEHGGS